MSLKVDVLQGGTNNHGVTVDDFNAFATDFLSDGVVGAITNTGGVAPSTGAFSVNAQGTPDKTVAIGTGTAYITGTPTSGVSQRLRVVNDASYNLTIADNATGGTRYDWIYISLDAAKMKDPAVDSTDVATLVASRSTSASTDNGTPPTYGYHIATVTVANGFSTITNANIALTRTETIPVRDASLTNSKLSTTAGDCGGAWKSWTPTTTNLTLGVGGTMTAYYTQIGKTVCFRIAVVLGSSGFSMGACTFTLPVSGATEYGTYSTTVGHSVFVDATGAWQYGACSVNTTTTSPYCLATSTAYAQVTAVSSSVPFTWAASDRLYMTGTYETA